MPYLHEAAAKGRERETVCLNVSEIVLKAFELLRFT